MPDEPTPPPAAPATEPTPTPNAPAGPTLPAADDAPLGEAGQKALDAMKERARLAEAKVRDFDALQSRLAEIEDANLNEVDRAIKAAADTARTEERNLLNAGRVADKIALAAATTFADPADAPLLLGDLTRFVVDGAIDDAAIASSVGELLKSKPHLAASTAPPAPPGVPTGAQGGGQTPSIDQQIAEAQAKGDARTVIALNNQKLAALATGS